MKNRNITTLLLITFLIIISVSSFAQKAATGKNLLAKKYTLLIVLTHADDFISIAPLIPKYAAEGHAVYYLALTGTIDSTIMAPGGIMYTQMQCAATALGFREATAFVDPNNQEQRMQQMRSVAWNGRHIIASIDSIKPDVLITWGPDGFSGNMRHILVSNVVTRVFQQQSLLKHKPRKLYYITYPESLFPDDRIPLGVMAAGSNANNNEAGPFGTLTDAFITTVINAKGYLKQARNALACFTLIKKDENKVWQEQWYDRLSNTLGGKVYLRLVYPATSGKEDIFKGL
jgi:LmbE family N-acetylglucosaminyl deacetylase